MELFIFRKILKYCQNAFLKNGKPKTVDIAIKSLIKKRKKINFVQIGASDCGLNDPLRQYILQDCAKGLIVEPIKKYFSKAQAQYQNVSNLYFANCAIDEKKGERTIYKIKEVEGLPEWAYQVCSFSRQVLLNHEKHIPNIAGLIEEESVRTEPITVLMKESGFANPDLLLVDTEGFDSEILKMFPFNLHCPALVIYEHIHLDEMNKSETEALLKKYKYSLVKTNFDVIATLRKYPKKNL